MTGIEPPEPGKPVPENVIPARISAGEIGKTRRELTAVRSEGVKSIGIKIGVILLAAFVLPRIVMWVLRRAMGGGSDDTSLVLSAIAAFVKAGIWVVAFALVLSVLGFDVTAIIAGLGIGGLAIGLAAQPMISDVIAALVIFAERKFAIGDVIRMGDGDPARVIGLSWRSTQLRNKEGLTVNVPNRKITEESVQNLTKNGKTYDGLTVTVKTDRDVGTVLDSIRKVLNECEPMAADHGVSVQEFTRKGDVTVVKYQFWWFLTHYEKRNQTRDEVFKRISQGLEEQDMKGTEVTLA
jgi:small-conductance mechanosensitive channel